VKRSLLLSLLFLTACSWQFTSVDSEQTQQNREQTLADLQPARLPDINQPLPSASLDQLSDLYREALSGTMDDELRVQVMERLAGLEMLRSEERLYAQQSEEKVFDTVIVAYKDLLSRYPDRKTSDRLHYQLSKAYDFNGQSALALVELSKIVRQHPDSDHFVEAEFRRAEAFFSEADYKNAEISYGNVIEKGRGTAYYQNALYMHGWSQFKRGRYRASLHSFSATLDLLVPEDNNLLSLKRGQRELVNDSFRVMSVVFSYLDGAETIDEVYNSLGERHYQPLLYRNLGELYLKQERYQDSAITYKAFVDRYPYSDQAPVFHIDIIAVYLAAGFTDDVLKEKEQYVTQYGTYSDYWVQKTEAVHEEIKPQLKVYLEELARHYHALAQSYTNENVKARKKSKNEKKLKPVFSSQKITQTYQRAANYYQEFIASFPLDNKVPEMTFLMAESRFEAKDFPSAIAAYEVAAYQYPEYPKAAEAGYSAIISYDRQLDLESDETRLDWRLKKIDSELHFSEAFKKDPRATGVLANAADTLFELNDFNKAATTAEKIIQWQPAVDAKLHKMALLIYAHSQFELQDYLLAEDAYQKVLKLIPEDSLEREVLTERLAASIYKQGEQALAQGDKRAAADQFLRVVAIAPNSSIRVNAQYDAASNFMVLGLWSQAISQLTDFRRRFPNHALTDNISEELVVAYQQNDQWIMAAGELTLISGRVSTDPAVLESQRESLFLAAEMYQKGGDIENARLRYRTYANTYPEPFPVAMEARYKLSEIYQQQGDDSKRRFWLNKIIAADTSAGTQRNDRSRYLAAFSSSVFANDSYQSYQSIKLSLPLKKSLKKKNRLLKKTVATYQELNDYGVEEFSTLAIYRIGEVYGQLSRDLLASERPKKLDELALEQYELLLEEQAYPFEEKSIAIHESNVQRSWQGIYDQWVKSSFSSLANILPARYGKQEQQISYSNEIY
jgi:TolA-binding protein